MGYFPSVHLKIGKNTLRSKIKTACERVKLGAKFVRENPEKSNFKICMGKVINLNTSTIWSFQVKHLGELYLPNSLI